MTNEASKSTRSSRACRRCAVAKAKCVTTPQNDICERCIRLHFNCEAQEPTVRKLRQPKAMRVSQLENKLDNVLTLLKASQFSGSPASSSHTYTSSSTLTSSALTSTGASDTTADSDIVTRLPPTLSQAINTSDHSREFPSDPPALIRLVDDDETALLNIFQTHMISHFPFVILSDYDPAILHTEKPFLLAAIVLGASRHKVYRQKPAARKLLQRFTEKFLLDGQTSLDLLQAILVYMQWCNFNYIHNPQISILIQLAVTLVAELGLNTSLRPKLTRQQQVAADANTQPEEPSLAPCHSTEEMRAFLGCFYYSSIISTSFKKVEAMPYTSYIEECCTALEHRAEFVTDTCLVKLVRIQVIMRNLAQSLPSEVLEHGFHSTMPISMIIKPLEAIAQKLLTPDMENNIPFLLQYHSLRISIYSISLHKPSSPPNSHHLTNFAHLSFRYSLLLSMNPYLETFFQIPPSLYFTLPSTVWIHLADIGTVMARLLCIEADGWDLVHARTVVDMPGMFEHLGRNFEEAAELGANTEDDMFRDYAAKMVRGKKAYEMKIAAEATELQKEADGFEGSDKVMSDFPWDDTGFWEEGLVNWGDLGHLENTGTWI